MAHTSLYRFYGSNNKLLYIGITNNLSARFNQHSQKAKWHHLVVRAVIEHFDSREEALVNEKFAIQNECPEFNIQHKHYGEKPFDHFNRLWDSLVPFEDEFHVALLSKMDALIEDAKSIGLNRPELKGWAFSNAIWELSLNKDVVDVPCQSCISLAWNPLMESAHATICDARFYLEMK